MTFDVAGTSETFDLDETTINGNLDVVWDEDCDGSISSQAFGTPEVDDADLETCGPGDTGYVVYFVTVDDA